MTTRVFGFALLCVATLLAACRGAMPPTDPASVAGASSATAHGRTTAWGRLVDDPSQRPLANVPVRLFPWIKCSDAGHHTRVVCPKAVARTQTNKRGGFVLSNVPAGHYLLVIGSDSPSDLVRPTIHDSVWLHGRTQRLLAPVLPAVPTYTATSVTPGPPAWRPPVERHGLYRLLTIRQTGTRDEEVPCIRYFDATRKAHNLQPIVIDEWLLENLRTFTRTPLSASHEKGWLAARDWAYGLQACKQMVQYAFEHATFERLTLNPQLRWFAFSTATYRLPHVKALQGLALMEMPLDARTGEYMGYPRWP